METVAPRRPLQHFADPKGSIGDLGSESAALLVAAASDISVVLAARAVSPDSVQIEVADTGPGISASDHERVFDRFYQSGNGRGEGFGLGLAIVREAVHALGGVVEIDSAPERGTVVRVTLPAATERA